jgi:murein L,D-transpeptidase YafK
MAPRPAAALLAVLLLLGAACSPGIARPPWLDRLLGRAPARPPAPAVSVPVVDLDSVDLPWAEGEEYLIVVRRACRTLDVYRWGHLIRRYPAVFGRNPVGPKLYEGDLRTPAGFYTIIEKRHHDRWARFMLLDYPNATDAQRYAEAIDAGELPDDTGRTPGIGGAIGIHGSDREELNARGIDWTLGCISLTSRDVTELDALVPVGTPVWIQE